MDIISLEVFAGTSIIIAWTLNKFCPIYSSMLDAKFHLTQTFIAKLWSHKVDIKSSSHVFIREKRCFSVVRVGGLYATQNAGESHLEEYL